MKIVVAGGTGFVGKSLVPRLRTENHEVVVLTRDPDSIRRPPSSGITIATWDGRTPGAWMEHVDGADAILNFTGTSIAASRWSPSQKEIILGSRVNPARALAEAVRRAQRKPTVLVNASAVGYYGDVPEGDVTEDHPPGNDFVARLCVQWEREAEAIGELGLRVVRLRTAVVLGEGGGALQKMILPFRFFTGGHIGSGRQWFPWVHRDDLVNIVMFALDHSTVSGPLNAAAPEQVTMKTFCTALGRAVNRPSWLPVPAPIVRLALGEMADMFLTGQRVVPARLLHMGYAFKFPTLALALTDIYR